MTSSRVSRRIVLFALASLGVALSAGFLVPAFITRLSDDSTFPLLTLAMFYVALGAVIPSIGLFRIFKRDWFHPYAFPMFFVIVTLFAPSVYVLVTHKNLPSPFTIDVSEPLLRVFLLTVLGLGLGIAVSLAVVHSRNGVGPPVPVDYRFVLKWGHFFLSSSVVLEGIRWVTQRGRPYGAQQTSFGTSSTVTTIAVGLVLIGVIFTTIGNAKLHRRVLRRFDVSCLIAFMVFSLLSGSRGDLLAPLLFILWSHHTYIKRVPLWRLVALTAVILAVFAFVGTERNGPTAAGKSLVTSTVTSLSGPSFITANVLQVVPSEHGFYHGSTYISAVERQVPGFIVNRILGSPQAAHQTGTYVYRDLIDFNSPNLGFGFSFPTESYLNFGMPGAFIIAAFVGLLIGWSYRRFESDASRALHLLYPILIVILPLEIRDDALGQIKIVLYPMIAGWLVLRAARRRGRLRSASYDLARSSNEVGSF